MSDKSSVSPKGAATKIFCINAGGNPGWMLARAIGEDGKPVASHLCSSEGFMRHDLGITSEWKHDKYNAAYPDGWELVDLIDLSADELDSHPAFMAAWGKLVAADLAMQSTTSEYGT